MNYLADAHREWHAVHGADTVCPLDCGAGETYDYDPEPEEANMTTIDLDLDTVNVSAPTRPIEGRPATERQIKYIADLVAKRDTASLTHEVEAARALVMARVFSSAEASTLIGLLLRQPMAKVAEVAEPKEGMHRMPDGSIYKVQRAVHGSGNLYAKRLVLTEPDCGGCANDDPCDEPCPWGVTFEYAPGIVRLLGESTRMTIEEAKEFGALYGTCIRCGRTLTDEGSIAAGIGPICAGRWEV